MKIVKLLQSLIICIIISMFGCSGQSTTDTMKEIAPAPAAEKMAMGDGAALYILNLSGWTLIPQQQVVLDNGQELVSLPRNTFARIIIPAGSHEIGFPYRKQPTLNLDAVKGEAYYLKVAHEARTSWAYSIEGDPIELKQLTEGEAKILLEKLEPLSMPIKKAVESAPAAEAKPVMQTDEPPPAAAMEKTTPVQAAEKSVSAEPPPTGAKMEMAFTSAAKEQLPVEEAKPIMKINGPPPMPPKNESVSTPPSEEMKAGGSPSLFIFNLSGWTLLSGNQTVLDNGSELASLPRNTYTKAGISPGMHQLGFKNREEPILDINAAKGGTYYVSFSYKQQSSWLSPTATDPIEIKQISEEEARQLMKRITFYH
jgi:hypothetical protein